MKPQINDIVLIQIGSSFSVGVVRKILLETSLNIDEEFAEKVEKEEYVCAIFGNEPGVESSCVANENNTRRFSEDYSSTIYTMSGFIKRSGSYKNAEIYVKSIEDKLNDAKKEELAQNLIKDA